MQTTERWFMTEALRGIWTLLMHELMEPKKGDVSRIVKAKEELGKIIDQLQIEDEREGRTAGWQ